MGSMHEKLEANFDGAKWKGAAGAVAGMYEVVTNSGVVYGNEQVTLLFSGRILRCSSSMDIVSAARSRRSAWRKNSPRLNDTRLSSTLPRMILDTAQQDGNRALRPMLTPPQRGRSAS
jgi:hypothetical protein